MVYNITNNTGIFLCFRRPQFATRAVLMSTEILKARGMYAEAAMEFIRMTGEVILSLLTRSSLK